jgi:hypothetical protein
MTGDDRKPWDTRLVEWMQRGSSTAKSVTWTPRARAFYAFVYLVLAITYGGAFFYTMAAGLVAASVILGVREVRQRK